MFESEEFKIKQDYFIIIFFSIFFLQNNSNL